MRFTPEEIQRGTVLVAVGDAALRSAVPAHARDAAAADYRPLLIAIAAMIVTAERPHVVWEERVHG